MYDDFDTSLYTYIQNLLTYKIQRFFFWISVSVLSVITFILLFLLVVVKAATPHLQGPIIIACTMLAPWLFMLFGYFLANYLKKRSYDKELSFLGFFLFIIFPYLPFVGLFLFMAFKLASEQP